MYARCFNSLQNLGFAIRLKYFGTMGQWISICSFIIFVKYFGIKFLCYSVMFEKPLKAL